MRFDTWLTTGGSYLSPDSMNDIGHTREADFGGKLGHPTTFSTVRDPKGHFQLRYPEGWTLETRDLFIVRSHRLPLSVRVDVLPGPEISWEQLRSFLGGLVVGEKRLPGPPSQVRGLVVEKEGLFEGRALAYPWGAVVVVLSTRMLQAPNSGLERYGRAVLATIRREFSVPAPGPPGYNGCP